jgi:hypothetical protein
MKLLKFWLLVLLWVLTAVAVAGALHVIHAPVLILWAAAFLLVVILQVLIAEL